MVDAPVLAARQAGSTLGTVNWGRFWKSEESYKDKDQVNNTTTTGYTADALSLGETNILSGWNNGVKHSAIIQHNFGAGDILEIERPDGKRFMVPMRAEGVLEWTDERLVISGDFVE